MPCLVRSWVLVALAVIAPARAQSPATADRLAGLVRQLCHAETLDDRAVGYEGARTATYEAYERLAATATTAELLPLTRHANPIVRGYAVRALAANGADVDWRQLLLDHLHDAEPVETFSGCCKAKEATGDVIFATVRDRLDGEQMLDVAEALVRERSPLHAREWALRHVTFRDGMLHELRQLTTAGDAPAAIALARFHVGTDVSLLIEQLQQPQPFYGNCRFLAAEISADVRLLPPLRALLPSARRRLLNDNATRLRFWIGAIAAQRSSDAAALLQDVLDHVPSTDAKRRDLATEMAAVLQTRPDPVFDAVRETTADLSR